MKVRRVKDPARRGRACYQYGHCGRVFCGKDARQRAVEYGQQIRALECGGQQVRTHVRIVVRTSAVTSG